MYSSEHCLSSGWLDESAVVSDAELEGLYNDLLREQMRGSSPVPSWSDDEDTERTIPLEKEEDRSERWGQLAPVVILDPPASPSTPPPSQPRRRSGTEDINLLAEAATAASLATRLIAPEAADALQALADAARRIGDTTAGSRLAVATAAAGSGDRAAASGAAASGDGAAALSAAASGDRAAASGAAASGDIAAASGAAASGDS